MISRTDINYLACALKPEPERMSTAATLGQAEARAFPKAVLFDLDGTLLDSAPDMLAVANGMRADRGRELIGLDLLRPHVSKGSRAMIGAAFPDIDPGERDGWVQEFLDLYERELGLHGAPFEGVEPMLAALEAAGWSGASSPTSPNTSRAS